MWIWIFLFYLGSPMVPLSGEVGLVWETAFPILVQLGWEMSCIPTALPPDIALAHLGFQQILLGSASPCWRAGGRKSPASQGPGQSIWWSEQTGLNSGLLHQSCCTSVKLFHWWGVNIPGILSLELVKCKIYCLLWRRFLSWATSYSSAWCVLERCPALFSNFPGIHCCLLIDMGQADLSFDPVQPC